MLRSGLLIALGILLPHFALAAGLADIGGFGSNAWTSVCAMLPYCGQGAGGVQIITGIIVKTVLWAVAGGAMVVILYAAARMISYAGNEEILTKSKKIIFYAALGLLLATLASTILNYIVSVVSTIVS